MIAAGYDHNPAIVIIIPNHLRVAEIPASRILAIFARVFDHDRPILPRTAFIGTVGNAVPADFRSKRPDCRTCNRRSSLFPRNRRTNRKHCSYPQLPSLTIYGQDRSKAVQSAAASNEPDRCLPHAPTFRHPDGTNDIRLHNRQARSDRLPIPGAGNNDIADDIFPCNSPLQPLHKILESCSALLHRISNVTAFITAIQGVDRRGPIAVDENPNPIPTVFTSSW